MVLQSVARDPRWVAANETERLDKSFRNKFRCDADADCKGDYDTCANNVCNKVLKTIRIAGKPPKEPHYAA